MPEAVKQTVEIEGPAVLGIIDTGIAFWNEAFRDLSDSARSRFREVVALEIRDPLRYRTPLDRTPRPTDLTADGPDIAAAVGKFDRGEERSLLQELAAHMPQSVYATFDHRPPAFDPEGFSHGTAMAALAAGNSHDDDRAKLPLIGLELPAAAVLDRSGDTLMWLIVPAVLALIQRVGRWNEADGAKIELTILLPYAFLGVPRGTQHIVAERLEQALADPALKLGSVGTVRFVIPTGNHRQGRVHGALVHGALPSPYDSKGIELLVMPDDHSASTLDVYLETDLPADGFTGSISLRAEITAPGYDPTGAPARAAFTITDNAVHGIFVGGAARIGAVWLRRPRKEDNPRDSTNRWYQLRLSLHPTDMRYANPRVSSGMAPAPYGFWRLRFLETDPAGTCLTQILRVKHWIVRDDADPGLRSRPRRRQGALWQDGYPERGADGRFLLTDAVDARVRRWGSASVLAEGMSNLADLARPEPQVRGVSVAAHEQVPDIPAERRPAWYSGAPESGENAVFEVLVDKGRLSAGMRAVGNGGRRLFRVSGTSAAAAYLAGQLAVGTVPTPPTPIRDPLITRGNPP